MYVDLIRVIPLLIGLLTHGVPGAGEIRVSLVYQPPGVALLLDGWAGWRDDRIARWGYCGLTIGSAVLWTPGDCKDTLQHERCHVRQMSHYGLIHPITYALTPWAWEDYLPGSPERMPCPDWGLPAVVIPLN